MQSPIQRFYTHIERIPNYEIWYETYAAGVKELPNHPGTWVDQRYDYHVYFYFPDVNLLLPVALISYYCNDATPPELCTVYPIGSHCRAQFLFISSINTNDTTDGTIPKKIADEYVGYTRKYNDNQNHYNDFGRWFYTSALESGNIERIFADTLLSYGVSYELPKRRIWKRWSDWAHIPVYDMALGGIVETSDESEELGCLAFPGQFPSTLGFHAGFFAGHTFYIPDQWELDEDVSTRVWQMNQWAKKYIIITKAVPDPGTQKTLKVAEFLKWCASFSAAISGLGSLAIVLSFTDVDQVIELMYTQFRCLLPAREFVAYNKYPEYPNNIISPKFPAPEAAGSPNESLPPPTNQPPLTPYQRLRAGLQPVAQAMGDQASEIKKLWDSTHSLFPEFSMQYGVFVDKSTWRYPDWGIWNHFIGIFEKALNVKLGFLKSHQYTDNPFTRVGDEPYIRR